MRSPIYKTYRNEQLFSNEYELERRARAIEALEVGVSFFKEKDCWIRETMPVSGKFRHPRRGELSIEQAEKLALTLQAAHKKGVTHGDVNIKNIYIGESGALTLSDWEIDLKQVTQGYWGLMGTRPWIHKIDEEIGNLSIKTDLLCYYSLIGKVNKDDIHKPSIYQLIEQLEYVEQPFLEMLNEIQ